MLTRLTHAAIAFAITVVVYQAYVLLAAPLIDPPRINTHSTNHLSAEERQAAGKSVHKYRDLLAAYFPPGHWTLTQPPISAENGQAMVLIDAFNPRDDGQIRVKKCAILFFPSGRARGEAPPTDAVVLEAPQGAVLQMDKSYSSGAGGFGRVQSGKLLGKITIRSNMREPGPHDDLLLTTYDVEIQEDLIYTLNKVNMQLGPHHGSGQHLEIRLVSVERSRTGGQSSGLGNLDYIEIIKDVRAQVSPGQAQLALDKSPSTNSTTGPPVQVTCEGRFRFDFSKQIASFDDNVLLTQVHPAGQIDQLQCKNLSLYFATADTTTQPNQTALGKLQVVLIEAISSDASPVLLEAQSQEARARCERIRLELPARRITFDHGKRKRLARQAESTYSRPVQDVELSFQKNEIHAPFVQYTAPPKDSPQRIGEFRASGSGWFRAATSNKKSSTDADSDPFEVRWTENMRLRRINGQPVLTLNGRPRLDMVGMGQLWSDYLDLYLRESAADGSEADLLPADVVPQRLVASGKIAIDSAQLRGHVKQLEVQFDYLPKTSAPSDLLLNGPTDNDQPARRSFARSSGGGLKRAYDITGQTLQMLVTVQGKQTKVTTLDVDGQVVFNESTNDSSPQANPSKQPLQVEADHLHVKNADSPSAEISLSGKPATITADGMLIRTENLQVNRGTSHAWVDAPGEIEMLVDRDLSGQPLPAPQLMTIRWQRSMELKEDRLTFSGNVQVLTAEGKLDTQHMVVRLTAPVRFDGAASQRRIEIAQLECHGGANALFSQRDAMGLASIQTIKLEESFFANLQTGKLRGEGPGQIESVHLSKGNNPLGVMGSGGLANGTHSQRNRLASAGPSPPSSQADQRLRFLGIKFMRGIDGNLRSRQVRVLGDVDAVYGPVDSWEQPLELTKRGMPGPDTIWISSQSLGVAESPLARLNRNRNLPDRNKISGLGPLELEAAGKVTIEGPYGQHGNFTAQSQLAKYDQSKKTFILEGNNQQPATITLQENRNGPRSPTSARKIMYFQDTGNIKVEGLMPSQFRQIAPTSVR